MKKIMIMILAALLVVSCGNTNSLSRSEWNHLSKRIKNDIVRDLAFYATIDLFEEDFSGNKNNIAKREWQNDYEDFRSYLFQEHMYHSDGHSSYGIDCIDYLVEDMEEWGEDDRCISMAEEYVKYFKDYYAECQLSAPKVYYKDKESITYIFDCNLIDDEFGGMLLYFSDGDWWWVPKNAN